MNRQPSDPFEVWVHDLPDGRTLAELGVRLRAAAGGGGAGRREPRTVARYFRPGRRSEVELLRLCNDAELRRSVASIGRVLAASQSARAESQSGKRLGRRWLALGSLVAASITGLLLVPALLDDGPLDAEHRSTAPPATELRIVAPAGLLAASPRIAWHPVLGAEVYEVEVTDARGRTIFSGRTTDTALRIPLERFDLGESYFFRVRAQVDVARWISSDFQEIVVTK